jgi:hypothetical protein
VRKKGSGKKPVLTVKQQRFVKNNYLKMSQKELAAALNCGAGSITGAMRKFGLRVPKELVLERRIKAMTGRSSATSEEDAFITANYMTMPIKKIADHIGRVGSTFVTHRLRQLGLVIPPEIIEQRKKDSRLKKGNTPPNKGKKQRDYMTPEAIAKTAGTRFKKGEPNHNTLYDGCITIRHEHPDRKGGRPYKYIRLSKGVWKQLHIYNWESANGPVPEGYILVAKDNDPLNCEPDNWELITHGDNMKRNSGSAQLTDGMVAFYMSVKGRKPDRELQQELLKHPELIELKREQLLLKRQIRERRNIKEAGTDEG